MLGQSCNLVFSDSDFDTVSIARDNYTLLQKKLKNDYTFNLDKIEESLEKLKNDFEKPDYIINCIGVIKPRITDETKSIANAYKINSVFPHLLDKFASSLNAIVLQIGTDCVFSGKKGNYNELENHDAADNYGLSKSLGELQTDNTKIIRSSIIGIENNNMYSLVSWIMKQEMNATINGFKNHMWNGVTTKTFATILSGIIRNNVELNQNLHLVPANQLNKLDLVKLIANSIGRTDLKVTESHAPETIDRTLSTLYPEINKQLWELSGFENIPSVNYLVENFLV